MTIKKTSLLAAALALLVTSLGAATPVRGLLLAFVDGADFSVIMPGKPPLKLGKGIQEGDFIPLGATIATGKGTKAELTLIPNGSVIRLAEATQFRFDAMAGAGGGKNAFTLLAGKLRAVAAKSTVESYTVATPQSVLGVRGTDFIVVYEPGKTAKVIVKDGRVSYAKIDPSGKVDEEIEVEAGEEADAYDEDFEADELSEEELDEYYEDMGDEDYDDEGEEEDDDEEEEDAEEDSGD